VIGLGSIGLLFCWLFKKRGATQILGIDPLIERCSAAEKFGAGQTISARSIEVVHSSRQHSGAWEAPDICVEAVGHQMETLNDCLELVKKQGTVLAFGVPDQTVYAIEYETFFRKNAQLIAAVTPEWCTYLNKALEIFIQEQEHLEGLVTHRFPIRSAQQAFTLYENHAQGMLKAILDAADWHNTAE
jgi:threonine dehydrogenase-like Zn-dependent dehydrogenase